MSEIIFDLIVIGSGPGGYVDAIRGAQLGLQTAIVEKDSNLGGTCLNVGCIPSKALLHSTEMFHFAEHSAPNHGINLSNLSINVEKLMAKKSQVVSQLRAGVAHLMKTNKIKVFKGLGKLSGEQKVLVQNADASETLNAPNIIIATGSSVIELPFLPFDGEIVVSLSLIHISEPTRPY